MAPLKLSALLEQITTTALLRTPNSALTDIRPVLDQVAEMLPQLREAKQRLPLLIIIYYLFQYYVKIEDHRKKWVELFAEHRSDFDAPSIESFVAHMLTNRQPGWTLEQFEELYRDYFSTRHHADTTNIGRLLEAAFSLHLAEMNRKAGLATRSRDLIALAVDAHPGHAALRAFEAGLMAETLPEIVWQEILLPARPKAEPADEPRQRAS